LTYTEVLFTLSKKTCLTLTPTLSSALTPKFITFLSLFILLYLTLTLILTLTLGTVDLNAAFYLRRALRSFASAYSQLEFNRRTCPVVGLARVTGISEQLFACSFFDAVSLSLSPLNTHAYSLGTASSSSIFNKFKS
jgi:hypothetical protein